MIGFGVHLRCRSRNWNSKLRQFVVLAARSAWLASPAAARSAVAACRGQGRVRRGRDELRTAAVTCSSVNVGCATVTPWIDHCRIKTCRVCILIRRMSR